MLQSMGFLVRRIETGEYKDPDELLRETAQRIIDLTTRYCGGRGEIIVPSVI